MTIGLYHPRAFSGDGGISRSVRSLASAMADEGYESRVIFDAKDDGRQSPESWRGISHRGVGHLVIPVGLADAVEDLSVVVLHSAWVSYNILAGRIAARLGLPYVLAPRGAYEPSIMRRRPVAKKTWWHLFERRLVREAAAIHVFFQSQVEQIRNLGFDGPVIVAPNGVRVPTDVSWDGGSSEAFVYVGRFDMEHKGLRVLIESMSLLDELDRPQIILCGPDWRGGKAEARRAVARYALQKWIHIGPPIYGREKFELMASARGFLYPSRFEAFGNSAAEAAALGVPVLTGTYPLGNYLAGRNAGMAVVVEPESVAEALLRLGKPEAAELGNQAREAMRSFSWRSVAAAWGSQLAELRALSP